MNQFLRFGLVGGVGFAVDAASVLLLTRGLGLSLWLAYALSFVIATLATWLLNRAFAFGQPRQPLHRLKGEYLRYFAVQSGGMAIRFGVIAAVLHLAPSLEAQPVVPLAFGSIAAMLFNFAGAKWLVFRPPPVLQSSADGPR